mmetsp:Transcript_18304/g.37485  ORF Transcript_18304/g.37485 Transcript_18304/m.37485 type:complete len:230 (-) Transcript_18304:495-1184(-)
MHFVYRNKVATIAAVAVGIGIGVGCSFCAERTLGALVLIVFVSLRRDFFLLGVVVFFHELFNLLSSRSNTVGHSQQQLLILDVFSNRSDSHFVVGPPVQIGLVDEDHVIGKAGCQESLVVLHSTKNGNQEPTQRNQPKDLQWSNGKFRNNNQGMPDVLSLLLCFTVGWILDITNGGRVIASIVTLLQIHVPTHFISKCLQDLTETALQSPGVRATTSVHVWHEGFLHVI